MLENNGYKSLPVKAHILFVIILVAVPFLI